MEKSVDAVHLEDVQALSANLAEISHDGKPVWEQRQTYGPAGIRGLATSKYVLAAAAFSTLGGMLFGYDQGVMAITLTMDQFLTQFPEISSTAVGSSFNKGLMTAMIELGAFFGAMNCGWIADKFSRKWSLFIASIIFIVGSVLQTAAVNFEMLIIARLIGGFGVGMCACLAPMYISEIAPPEIRGTLLVIQELSIVTGIVIAFYITYATRHIQSHWSWRGPFLIQMFPALCLCVGVVFLPYSPRWLCGQDRDEESLKTLSRLRGVLETDSRVQQEWYEIRSEVAYRREIEQEKYPHLQDGTVSSTIKLQANNWADTWRGRNWRRTQVGVGLMFFQQFVGINALIYYSPTLFKTMGLDYEMQLTMSGVLNICQVIACLWALWGMDRFGRRQLLLYGGVCMFIAHFIIAVLVGLYHDSWPTHSTEGWVATAMLLFFMLSFGATWGPIPWAMPAEVFPSSIRAKGCAQATMSNWGNNFIIGLITPPMIEGIGFGTYVFFGVFCLIALVWVWFFIPETNGRTLEQMDYVFKDTQTNEEKQRRARIEACMINRVNEVVRNNSVTAV
ncbi:putative MFS monosaccharide transporter [Aureobasidium pullulans]|uniref:Putative MFS monosaccharide transporter n=1 Tax=Aureobasidium pullulans TaxID=5580 RepID=A0A4S9K199_AURPU|nr:putative MFS monosaccharide transporter [Aureobasidium pullulans]